MTIFWKEWGPAVRWNGRALTIEDLNPEVKMTWVITRIELFTFGLRMIAAALWR